MEPQDIRLDDPDDEVLPASRRRRRRMATLGVLAVLLILVVLIWYVASYTRQYENPGLFG